MTGAEFGLFVATFPLLTQTLKFPWVFNCALHTFFFGGWVGYLALLQTVFGQLPGEGKKGWKGV